MQPTDANFFLLVVQCPTMSRSWFGSQEQEKDRPVPLEPGEAVMAILKWVLATQLVDPERVSLFGISSGGSATWEIAARYPEVFSAVAPTASSGANHLPVEKLTAIPVWAFYNEKDSEGLKSGLASTVRALQAAGGIVQMTAVPGNRVGNHDAWSEAYGLNGLRDWLLDQNRGQGNLTSRWKFFRHMYLQRERLWLCVSALAAGLLFTWIWWRNRQHRVDEYNKVHISEADQTLLREVGESHV